MDTYQQRETYGLGATDELWTTIDRLAPGASGREIFAAIVLATFDALAVVVKRNDISLSTFPDPVSVVALYQSLLVNRVPTLPCFPSVNERSLRCLPHDESSTRSHLRI